MIINGNFFRQMKVGKSSSLLTIKFMAAFCMLGVNETSATQKNAIVDKICKTNLLSNSPFLIKIKDVSGTIINEKGEVLKGVTVSIKGSKTSTVTDEFGRYRLPNVEPNAVLVFSYIGCVTQEINLNNNAVLDVKLLTDKNELNEVIVVGYGSQKKANVTGAISTVTSKEIRTASNGNVVNLLAGKLPGLRVTQRTSEPGSYASDFDIRGFGTPLIVIDGVPRDGFYNMDPNEIESISVLKDASAAVYGVKGGNGVILITTKKGNGQTVFNYSSIFGISQITNSPQTLNAYQYATLLDEAYLNAGNVAPYSQETLEKYRTGELPSTDWYNLVVRKNAPMQQHNISASGSSDKVKYFMSAGYFDETGIWKSGDLRSNRYNFRSNVSANLTKDIEAEFLISGIKQAKLSPGGTEGIFQALWTMIPTISIYANDNPNYLSNMADATHPIAITNSDYTGYNNVYNNTFNGSLALNYKIPSIDGLKARALFAYDYSNVLNKVWQKTFNLYDYDAATDSYNVTGTRNAPTTLNESYSQAVSTTAQLSLDYTKAFESGHNLKVLLLVEQRKQDGLGFNGSRQFALDAVDELYAGNTDNQSITSTAVSPNTNQGIVGRVNYDYKGKYLFEGSFREDGSSKFAERHRWGFFPAVSAGWKISDENFMKDRIRFINSLKLRASYGRLGDDASSTYQYLSGYNYPGSNYVLDGTLVNGLGFRGLSNENLSWYINELTNIGIDADVFSNHLHVEADFFIKKRDGLLATRILSLPGTVGASLPQENLNSDLTKGFELAINYKNKIGDFSYNIGGNIAFTRTKNLYIEQADYTNSYTNWVNNAAYRWNDNYFGYKVIGQFQNYEEIMNSPIEDGDGNRSVLPGDFKYQDLNNDGIINEFDKQIIGNGSTTPKVNFGFNIGASWKGFDFNALFQGASKFTVSYLNTISLDAPLPWGRNGLDVFLDRWHHEDLFDQNSAWVSGKYPSTRLKSGITRPDTWNYQASDFWLRDATYIRLKNIELGYTLPTSMVGKSGFIKTLRIYANAFNLITWTGLSDLIDPEHTNNTYGLNYPITRNYNFGVNATF